MTEYNKIARATTSIKEARAAFSSEPPNKNQAMTSLGIAYTEVSHSIASQMELLKKAEELERKTARLKNLRLRR